jgi:hypothetical protein
MVGTAAGRRDVCSLWLGGGLAQVVGLRPRSVRGCVCVLRSTGVRTSGERARGCTAERRTDAKRLGGAAGVATASDGLRM